MNKYKIKRYFLRFLGKNVYPTLEELRNSGMKIGNNVDIIKSYIDPLFPEMISIGNNVTITNSTLLAHDASLRKIIGFSKFSPIKIGDNVFIGYGSIILPGVTIGNNVIVGAGSVVTKNIPDDYVVAGTPPQPVRERLFGGVSHRAEPLSRLHLSPSKGIYFFILKFCFMLNNSS